MQSPEFIQLLTTHQSRLYAYILTLVFDPNDADDVLQETNTVLWSKADSEQRRPAFDSTAREQ